MSSPVIRRVVPTRWPLPPDTPKTSLGWFRWTARIPTRPLPCSAQAMRPPRGVCHLAERGPDRPRAGLPGFVLVHPSRASTWAGACIRYEPPTVAQLQQRDRCHTRTSRPSAGIDHVWEQAASGAHGRCLRGAPTCSRSNGSALHHQQPPIHGRDTQRAPRQRERRGGIVGCHK